MAHGSPLKVDLSRSGRSDTRAPGFSEWQVNPALATTNFGGIRMTLRRPDGDGRALESGFYKSGIDSGAKLACDGVMLRGAAAEAGLELVFHNLTPGPHTLATIHNLTSAADADAHRFNIAVNDALVLTNVLPTVQITNDYYAARAYVRFDAKTGRDTVVKMTPPSPKSSNASSLAPIGEEGRGKGADPILILNGFELDGSNPARRARMPSPENHNEHVDGDFGSVELRWSAPAGAHSHSVYFGTDSNAVASADRKSPQFMGSQNLTTFTASRLNHFDTYYWRVDEVDANGEVTPGELWRFRTCHLAFPTAEGYGRFARGGRGGRVIEVTSLADSGPGTLRAAIEGEGPRMVVFNVSGLITLESKLVIRNPHLTIAGQTAPGKGICIRKFNLGMMGAHDVIVRYLRVRPGNISGLTLDGMGMASSDHCIIDHCSISWTLDEAFSSRGAKNITLQRTLISEALNEAGHKKYPPGTQHGYAASIGGSVGSFHHNLLAHCAGRNWSLAGGLDNSGRFAGRLDIRNNVVYNWKNRATDGGAHQVNFVNNYYQPGPSTRWFHALNAQYGGFPGTQQYYVVGNVMPGHFGVSNQTVGRIATTERGGELPTSYSPWVEAPFFEPHVKTHTAVESYTNVLADVGCNFPVLDEHDMRVLAEVRAGTFQFKGSKTGLPGLPDSQEDVGGWEQYPEERRPANWDTDHDGMPDEWERRTGLNPSDARDGNLDRNGDGYTNLEKYLNSLVGEYSLTSSKSPNLNP